MGCIPQQYLTDLIVIFSPTKVSFSKQQIQSLITTLNNIRNYYHYNYSSTLRQWYFCLILHFINTNLYLFITTAYKFTMVDLLLIQLRWITNAMIMNNWVTDNNILSSNNVLLRILSIIFVFGDCNGCKNNGNIIVGINIYIELYILILKGYLNSMKSINIRLVFCFIIAFDDALDIGGAGTKLYVSKEYGNDIRCLASGIDYSRIMLQIIIIIFVYNDKLNVDYGVLNAFVGFTIIHDNYIIQGYCNNSKELCILCGNQAETSNMIDHDLSTNAINTKIN